MASLAVTLDFPLLRRRLTVTALTFHSALVGEITTDVAHDPAHRSRHLESALVSALRGVGFLKDNLERRENDDQETGSIVLLLAWPLAFCQDKKRCWLPSA